MRTYRTLLPFFKRYFIHYVIGVLALVSVDFASLLLPQIFRQFADLTTSGLLNRANLFGLIEKLLAIGLVTVVGRFVWRTQIIGSAQKIDYGLRDQLFRKYLSLDTSYYNVNRTGDLMAHATNDIAAVKHTMSWGVMMVIDSLFMTLFTVIMMVSTAGLKTAAVALVSLPFLVFAVSRIIKPLNRRSRIVQNTFGELTTEVQENLSGIRVIKAFAIEDNRSASFEKVNQTYMDRVMDLNRVDGLFDPLINLISGLSFAIFLYYGAGQVRAGLMTMGAFVAIIEYLFLIIWPLIALGLVTSSFQRGMTSLERLNEVFRAQPKIVEEEGSIALDDPQGRVVFDHVSFRYGPDLPWVLKDISFDLEPGKSLALLGRTGVGKTTVLNLLLRRYDVSEGRILIDGVDIRNLTLASIYQTFGVVAQSSFLFSRSIAENIAFAEEETDQERVEGAAQFAQVAGDIEDMSEGYESLVGERGVTLSGGQQQRVSIARAYYKDAPVLIMDDSLSAVDTETESRILTQLAQHRKGLIMVSQRVSTVEQLDYILVLEEGQITQEGTHEELVAQKGFYQDLYHRQLLESEANEYRKEAQHV